MNEQQKIALESDIIDLIHSGNKIKAIKMLRERRNIGLKESKDIVDRYTAGVPDTDSVVGEVKPTDGGIKRSGSSNKVVFMAIAVFAIFMIYRQFS